MSTILEHPDAQALLEETEVSPADVRSCGRHLTRFLERYLPLFYRDEQRQHADTILRGKLTGQQRRPLQHFVGAGKWADAAVLRELRRHAREELADPQAVLSLDNHGVPK